MDHVFDVKMSGKLKQQKVHILFSLLLTFLNRKTRQWKRICEGAIVLHDVSFDLSSAPHQGYTKSLYTQEYNLPT